MGTAWPRWFSVAGAIVFGGCWSAAGGAPRCLPLLQPAALPESIRESSGVVASRRYEGVYWTLDDSGPPELYAVDAQGVLLGRVTVPADLGSDREDLSLDPCDSGDCLYIADVGDNLERRRSITLYRLPEPDPTDEETQRPEVFRFRLPDGPRDVEAAFVLPGERFHLITKGRNHPPTLYRYPGPLRDDSTVVLEEVQRFGQDPRPISRQVTGADASSDGRIVVVRTYETLDLFRVVADTLAPIPGSTVDLRTLREPQGEGVGLAAAGRIVLTSERGPFGGRGSIALLGCEIDW
jgi:hypothetical protein